MKTVILAGGAGTRLSEETDSKPKPMVEIGGKPILWHIMSLYSAHGFGDFVVALGYKGEVIKSYFLNFNALNSDLTVDLAGGQVRVSEGAHPRWTVSLVDTGLPTATGGRLHSLRSRLEGERFMMTYGDGLGDIDIRALVAFHQAHGKLATVTAVRPAVRFGGLNLDGDCVTRFSEKPPPGEHSWINGGYFVLEPGVLDYISGDDMPWEDAPLQRLAAEGQLMAYRHRGFWQPMDTLREKRILEALWQSGAPPWKIWE